MKIETLDSILIIEPFSQDLDEIKVIFEKENYDKLYYVVQFIEAVEKYEYKTNFAQTIRRHRLKKELDSFLKENDYPATKTSKV